MLIHAPLPHPLQKLLTRTKVPFTFKRPVSSTGLIHRGWLEAQRALQQVEKEDLNVGGHRRTE